MPDSLTLRLLRRIDAKIDGVIEIQHEHGHRLNRMEIASGRRKRD
jgi:hypothetical protein